MAIVPVSSSLIVTGLCALVLAFALAAAPMAVAADTGVPLGGFDVYDDEWVLGLGPEYPGADGVAALDRTQPHDGAASLRVAVDFSNGGRYVQLAHRFEGLPLKSLGGWVRGDGIAGLGFRVVDSSGQVFQSHHIHFKDKAGWQKLSVELHDLLGAEHWGGANDGAWHGPLKSLSFMIGPKDLVAGRTAGALWFDALEARLEPGAARPAQPAAVGVVAVDACEHATDGWNFTNGPEFPGALGALVADHGGVRDGKGCLRMDADLANGGAYVAATISLAGRDLDLRELRLAVKRVAVAGLGVRFIDDTGQCHQGPRVALKPVAEWQEVAFPLSTAVGGEHWGGANDGVWHPPAKAVSLVLSKGDLPDGKGTLWIDDLRGVARASTPKPRAP